MTPRYYDAAGHIDHAAIEAYARDLRAQAVDAFWRSISSKAQRLLETGHLAAAGPTAGPLQTGNSRLSSRSAHRTA